MSEMRIEKRTILAKRLALKEAVEFSDIISDFKDKVHKIASESGLDEKYLMDWAMEQLDVDHIVGRIEEDEEESD